MAPGKLRRRRFRMVPDPFRIAARHVVQVVHDPVGGRCDFNGCVNRLFREVVRREWRGDRVRLIGGGIFAMELPHLSRQQNEMAWQVIRC